jgi:membrane associated rhomboid family serine protease
MIPLRDSVPSHHTPFINYILIALCSLAFYAQISSGDGGQEIIERYGMVPLRLTSPEAPATTLVREAYQTPVGIVVQERRRELYQPPIDPWLTLITCIFLHGGWMHFIGNMWFLFIFGDNVEDRFGHIGYLIMYLGTGVAAGLCHLLTNAASPVPTIGASGAIAGVMGAYALLYPHARVYAVLPLFIFFKTFVLPAPIFLGIWFIFQIVNGMLAVGASTGVAWWAHIGGFAAGLVVAIIVQVTGFGRTETTEDTQTHRF